MAYSPNPQLLKAIRTKVPRNLQSLVLATALVESGGRLNAVGDHAQSFGPYQEYTGGRGAGLTPRQREDPYGSTVRATKEFASLSSRFSGPELAYRAQRPADHAGYVAKIKAALPYAQRLLQSGGPSATDAGAVPPAAPASPSAGSRDTKRLFMLLDHQRQRSLQGIMPAAGFQSELQKVVSAALPRAQVNATAQGVGAQVAQAGATTAGALAVQAGQTIVARQVPYSWGGGNTAGPTRGTAQGAGTIGFDCSSFAQYIWAKQGVAIPRTTYGQIKAGKAVASIAQAQPGDLLFPSTGHVQIYIGGGHVIEEPHTGGHAQVAPVRSSYIAIRRPA